MSLAEGVGPSCTNPGPTTSTWSQLIHASHGISGLKLIAVLQRLAVDMPAPCLLHATAGIGVSTRQL